MGKIIHKYENDLDKSWYDSSNILYSECDDKENQLKTVRVTFKNGATYEYKDVNVQDYLFFRDSISNGKAFIKYIKKYECEKLENKDTEALINEMNMLIENNKQELTEDLIND